MDLLTSFLEVECRSKSGGLEKDEVCKRELGPSPSRTESCFVHCYHHCKFVTLLQL